MKRAIRYSALTISGAILVAMIGARFDGGVALAQQTNKLPEVVTLGQKAAMGKIAFSHGLHSNGTYKGSAGKSIECVQCHHTAQPASDVAKRPGFKTAWPKDRTTTLTAELFLKDPTAAGVAACRDCHARSGTKPNLLPSMPQIKYESSENWIDLSNQPAFHRGCTECHMELKAANPGFKGPGPAQCTVCHKRDE